MSWSIHYHSLSPKKEYQIVIKIPGEITTILVKVRKDTTLVDESAALFTL